jgi:predicted N-formylglutamate amidohydrolase
MLDGRWKLPQNLELDSARAEWRMADGSLPRPAAEPLPPDVSPVARIENPLGASPVLLICEHASNHLPPIYGTLGLSPEERESHIAWDPGALGVAQHLAEKLDAPLVHATVSRLVIDLNRDPTAPDSIVAMSERTAVPGNADLCAAERDRRVREVYGPFHRAVETFMDERAARTRTVVSIHSFTPVYRDVARPWHVGLIFDADDRLAQKLAAALRQDPTLVVGMNEPYSPADRVFHTLERQAVRRGLAPLMIEIRNDLIRTAGEQAQWGARLAPLIAEAVSTL